MSAAFVEGSSNVRCYTKYTLCAGLKKNFFVSLREKKNLNAVICSWWLLVCFVFFILVNGVIRERLLQSLRIFPMISSERKIQIRRNYSGGPSGRPSIFEHYLCLYT